MEVYPVGKMKARLGVTFLACLFFSLPFIAAGRALFMVPVVFSAGAVYYLGIYSARYRKRRRISENPLTDEDRGILERNVSFYGSLSVQDRKSYETDIAVFLAEHRISGVDDVEITRKVALLVAATAVRLVFRRPEWEFRDFGEILVYPGGFRTDGSYSTDLQGSETAAAGLVHSSGNVILSLPHLLRGFQHDNDGYNVGYHEFAHVLDGYHPDGIPDELSLGAYRPWVQVMQKEFEKVHKGRSMLRQYAGTNPAEFFACAVEAFFEKPEQMRSRAPELYRQLAVFFNQKP
ncbi:MAG: zinc-dependent peptidase [Candidatus Fermentibacteraceae bacterium]|nr:zinc-dependent peptidase [Candidatus Fermentibacteraceae bacterium]MBN2608975.1 zinc-dependent peptidase [Candidatus Fermentibacteraceae bacterium]